MLPAANHLANLDIDTALNTVSGSGNPCGGNGNNCNIGTGNSQTILPNTPATAYGGNLTVTGTGSVTFQTGGTFFFNGSSLNFGGSVTGTNVNIVLLGNSNLSITGNANLSANFNNTTYPELNGVLFDDQAPNKANNAVTINGGAGVTIALGGSMYFPNVDVTMSGNSQNTNTQCTEVIANSLKFSGGTSYLSTQGCDSSGQRTPTAQFVVLVQ
jgi:hypothetical protein